MATLRLTPLPWALLVGLPVFLIQLTPRVLSSVPGTPLTDVEYTVFFSSQKPMWKASLVCQIRHSKGCNDPRITQLDQFENHGEIPAGPICSDLPDDTHFESFCQFAQFRCLNHKFYAKRIPCSKPTPPEEIIIVSSAPSKAPSSEISPPPEIRLHSNIDAILKYAFAVSGEEPVTRKHNPTPEIKWRTLQGTTLHKQSEHTSAKVVTVTAETLVSDTQKAKAATVLADQVLHQSIHRLIGKALSLEKSMNADNDNKVKRLDLDLTDEEAISEAAPKGSLLSLDKNAALVILCYAILQDICIATAVSKAWQQIETKTFGYGDEVCDSFGRRHTDLCSECAFCSLKIEQCQGASSLRRVHCDDGTFTEYINPGILAQHQAMVPTISEDETEFYGIEAYGGLQTEYWCGRLATHGCDDYRIALWLQSEYSSFKGGDFPDKICDSDDIEHPTYCAFKSNQCREFSLSKKKVFRVGCFENETYRVLSKDEGEDEVLLWSEKFSSTADV